MAFTVRELSPRTLADFEQLAVKQGSCWCMYYQRPKPVLRGSTVEKHRAINKRDKAKLVRAGRSHAILVYEGETPIGWCQYGPREELPRIDAGRNYRKVGPPETPGRLWRITCFFVDRVHRGRGVAKVALKAAPRLDQATGRRHRRSLSDRLAEDGGRAGMALVWDSRDVSERGFSGRRSSGHERRPDAEDHHTLGVPRTADVIPGVDSGIGCIYTLLMSTIVDLAATKDCRCLAARREARAITRMYEAKLRPHGLRATQFSILAALALKGPTPVRELATVLGLERTTLTRSSALLEEKGWARSARSEDGREHPIQLTSAGRRRLEAAFPAWQAAQVSISHRLGSTDR